MSAVPKGHLYIIQSEEGPVKIGISIRPRERIAALESTSGRRIVRTFISPEMEGFDLLEGHLHQHFSEQRSVGEWFHVNFKDAVRAAHIFGAAKRPKEWAESSDYIQGAAHRMRMFDFYKSGPHTGGEWDAFHAGLGQLAQEQIEYADYVDRILAGETFRQLDKLVEDVSRLEQVLGIPSSFPAELWGKLKELEDGIKDDMREAGLQVEPFWGS